MTTIRTAPLRGLGMLGALGLLTAGCAITPPGATAPPQPPASTPTLIAAPEPSEDAPSAEAPSAPASAPATRASSAATTARPTDPVAALQPDFRAYQAAINQVLQAGGQGAPTQAMKDTMSGAELDRWIKQATDYRTRGLKQVGDLRLETFLPGEVDKAAGTASVDFCVTAADAKVTDAAGQVVAPKDPAKPATGSSAMLAWSDGRWRVIEVLGQVPLAACP